MSTFGKELISPKTLEDMIAQRDKTANTLREIHRLLENCEADCKAFGNYLFPSAALRMSGTLEEALRELDSRFWRHTFDLTRFNQIMDAEAAKKFREEVDRLPPVFSMDNVRSTFATLFQDADMMFRRGLVNVLRRLSLNYKTNRDNVFTINRKVIMGCMFQPGFGKMYWTVRWGWASDTLNDIDRIFYTLDKKPHKPRRLETAVNGAFAEARAMVYEDEYFSIKGFRNGNMHLIIKRADLLELANDEIAAFYGEGKLADQQKRRGG